MTITTKGVLSFIWKYKIFILIACAFIGLTLWVNSGKPFPGADLLDKMVKDKINIALSDYNKKIEESNKKIETLDNKIASINKDLEVSNQEIEKLKGKKKNVKPSESYQQTKDRFNNLGYAPR